MSAAPSLTPSSSTRAGSRRRRCRPPRARRSPCSPRPARSAPATSSASRTGRPSPRTRCSSARARGRPSSRPRGSSTSSTCAGRRERISTGSASTTPSRSCRWSAASESPSAIGPEGVLRPLDLESLDEIDAEAVAVCLLFSFRDPSHERELAAELRRRLPAARIVASHEVAPEFREYERASTTAIDAYLGPTLAGYLEALARHAPRQGFPEPLVMRSSGGVATIAEAAAHPAFALLSGPAAGVVGAAIAASSAGVGERDLPRHGRHLDRRRADQGRRGRARLRADVAGLPRPAAQRRPADRRRGRRLDRVGRRGRRAARGPRKRRRGARAGLLRQGRHAPDGDRRQPPARQASRAAGRGPAAGSRGRGASARRDRPGGSRRSGERGDAARAAGSCRSSAATIRETSRSSRSGERGRCTRASWPRSSASRRCSCPKPPASCRRWGSPRATSAATGFSRTSSRWPRPASSRSRARRTSGTRGSPSS